MTRFASALAFVVASASSVAASHIPETLHNVANIETMRNPSLRTKDAERKSALHANLAASVVKPSKQLSRKLDEAAAADEEAVDEYYWDESMDASGIGFDITNYAVKYTKCATVQSYSDNLAVADYTDTVLAAQRFALFRLCPKDQCSASSDNGCGSNYGEYVVSLDKFMLSMLEYQESRVAGYCEYCQNCAAIEAAKNFHVEVKAAKEAAVLAAQTAYNTWYEDWLATQYANGNNVDEDGDGQVDTLTAAQAYYTAVKDGNNYANTYAANNYGSSYSASTSSGSSSASTGGYSVYNQNMWEVQNSQNKVYANSEAWSSMGSQSRSGTFYGKPVLNGYYENGVFYNVYGYFNGENTYVNLEDYDTFEWDEALWGEMPEGFQDIDENTESCLYKYAGSCYNQYDACMQILEDEDYTMYQQYMQQVNAYNSANGYQAQPIRATLKEFVQCVEVFPMEKYGNQYYQQSQYAQQQSYQQTAQQYNCYDGDENCQKMQEYSAQMYAYQQEKLQNRRYFVGPNCASNGRDIALAVYEDEYCSVLDSSSTVESVLGYSPYSSNLDLFPSECLSCFTEEQEAWYEDEEVYTLEPMCSMLYQYSGKCNKHLTATEYNYDGYAANGNYEYQNQNQDANSAYADYANNEWKQMYQSENQAQNENAVCSFLESLASNTYNENGEINVSGATWASWKKEYSAESRAMNAGMKAALVITALAAMAMAVTACVLHSVLARKNIPWKPRRSKGVDPTDLARKDSGITMGRSRSGATGAGTNPLL
jgi:hypothetical protein